MARKKKEEPIADERLLVGGECDIGLVDDGKVLLRQMEHCANAFRTLFSTIRSRGVKLASSCDFGSLRATGFVEIEDEEGEVYYIGVLLKCDLDASDKNSLWKVETEFFTSYDAMNLFVGTDDGTEAWGGPWFVPPVGSVERRGGESLWRAVDEDGEEMELTQEEALQQVVEYLGLD